MGTRASASSVTARQQQETMAESMIAAAMAAGSLRPRESMSPAEHVFGHDQLGAYMFSFLEPRELFRLVFASKEILRLLRHEHVVRSAMMAHVKMDKVETLECNQHDDRRYCMRILVRDIKAQSIWTPSPLRLLRLVNATGCERCAKSHTGSAGDASADLGVCLCGGSYCPPGCLNELCRQCQGSRHPLCDYLKKDNRICQKTHTYMLLVFAEPFFVDSTGEMCGPMLSTQDLPERTGRYPNFDNIPESDFDTVDRIHQERVAMDKYVAQRGEIIRVFDECEEAIKKRVIVKK